MYKRLLPGLAVCVAIVGGCFAWSETPRAASQEMSASILPARTNTARATLPNSAVALEMFALERHARMDMILSSGPVSQWASAGHSLTVVAVTLNAGK